MARTTTLTGTQPRLSLNPPAANPPAADLRPELFDLPPIDLHDLLRGSLVRVEAAPPRRHEYPGETPAEGQGAVTRWLALHDHAHDLRAAVQPENGVAVRQARRAICSLFLYEHQLTAKARRQARSTLWRREREEPLPAFAERARWSRCRCPECQPQFHAASVPVPETLAETLLRSA